MLMFDVRTLGALKDLGLNHICLLLVHFFSNPNTVASKLYNSYIDSAPLQFGKLENNSENSYKAEVF